MGIDDEKDINLKGNSTTTKVIFSLVVVLCILKIFFKTYFNIFRRAESRVNTRLVC